MSSFPIPHSPLPISLVAPLLLAVLIDLALGDPPNRFHPVAWMGSLIAAGERRAPRSPRLALAWGAAIVCGGVIAMIAFGLTIQWALRDVPPVVAWCLEAAVLTTMFSIRGLVRAASAVRDALAQGDLPNARSLVSRHLVSRDTSQLDGHGVAAATIESAAENASDSVIAPLFYYALAGLAGVLVYRFVNTADAMLGYHSERYEWLGKMAARLDDVLNFVPARLTALFILLVAPLVGGSLARGWSVWRSDARLTLSPNAGHPMSAASGALGVELEKVGCYRLGAGQGAADWHGIDRMIALFYATVALGVASLIALAILVRGH
jgi:adenosylcobinamide-phosphate synthase